MSENEPSGRQRALLDLGGWPVRRDLLTAERAVLMAAAWRAGARNVAELARVADVSRDVVYADLRSQGIEPTDAEQKKEPPMPRTASPLTARARLRQELARVFADDRGLGLLVEFNGRPDMTKQGKDLQYARAGALIALHGRDRSAAVFAEYATQRQRAADMPRLTKWDDLVLGSRPLPAWTRDVHGYLCDVCGESFPSLVLLEENEDVACKRCARDVVGAEPGNAVRPLWSPWSRHLFQYPGHWEREEQAKPESELVERLPDGGERRWAIGEAGAFTQETSGLPGVDVSVQRLGGPDYDDPAFYIEGRTEHAGRAYSFAVTFTYDGQPQPFEVRPYGWRFSSGEIQEVAATPSSPVEYTDVYEMLDAMLVGLYAPDGEGEGR